MSCFRFFYCFNLEISVAHIDGHVLYQPILGALR